MDFLDSFDVDIPKYKKSRRVRSWYLYEQFKSLERNQLDAARKLKSRSYQDRILRQELSERKARRKLYDQLGDSQSECGFEHSIKSEPTKTSLNISTDDFFESFHEFEDDEELTKIGDLDDDDNQSDCNTVKYIDDELKNVNDQNDQKKEESYSESVVNALSEDTLTEHVEIEKLPKPQHTPTHIELNFDVVKDFQCLERLKMGDLDKYSENDDMNDDDDFKHMMHDKNVTTDNNLYFMWTKLVSFAYQIMELNHGNCYYDYGSQLLTAVLACDVLRRGINRMCHDSLDIGYVPQSYALVPSDQYNPYVSLLGYSTDADCTEKKYKIEERKKYRRSKYSSKIYERRNSTDTPKLNATAETLRFENILNHSQFLRQGWDVKKFRRSSEPGRRYAENGRYPMSMASHQTAWPRSNSGDLQTLCISTRTCQKVVNPMLHVTRYLDEIMRCVDDL